MTETEIKIKLPYEFVLRSYQAPVIEALEGGRKRAVCVWHRRSGKDKTFVNFTAMKMEERVGAYFYFFPTYAQGKKILWDGRDRAGFKFTDHFPQEARRRTNNSEMKIEMENGSLFQVIGTDKIDAIVGSNPLGCVFTEYALQSPVAWDYIRPILAENNGWAIFNFTPRGKNHGFTLFKSAQKDPDVWFAEVLTVEDTGAIPREVLEQERKEIIAQYGTDALYQQEYMCSFDVPIQGSYYGLQLMQADEQKRIGNVPYDPAARVCTAWDLGIGDEMAIWFFQLVGQEIRVIDYYETTGEGLAYYVKHLQSKPYVYDQHFAPHDITVRELATGKSRLEVAKGLGIDFTVAPMLRVEDGIEAVRSILARCWFDSKNCEKGLSALRSYHKEFDEKNQVYKLRPHHDWASHGCLVGDSLVKAVGGDKRIDRVGVGDKVWTPAGYSKVTNAGVTKFVDELLEIEFSNGVFLRCTPEHKFFTNRGLVYADALRYNDVLWTQKNHKRLSLTASLLGYRRAVVIIDRGLGVLRRSYTGRFGNFTMGRFLKGVVSTIKTAIHLITCRIISFAYPTHNTPDTTSMNDIEAIPIGTRLRERKICLGMLEVRRILRELRHYNPLPKRRPKSGIDQKRESSGTQNTVRKLGWIGSGLRRTVNSVVGSIKQYSQLDQGGVVRVVNLKHVPVKSQPVYDLTVDKHQCYLANGLLVSNSDAFRTFAVSYRKKAKPVRATVRVPVDDPY